MSDQRCFWFQVHDAARQLKDPKSQAFHYWSTPLDGVILTNDNQHPYGVPLRAVSEKLAELGPEYCNGKGKPYHPYQLQEMLPDGYANAVEVVLQIKLTPEQREAVKRAFVEGCRQKRSYEHLTEEEECRRSWRTLPRAIKRRRPWDQSR